MKDYNIKSIKEDFKKKGIFYTTKDLAEYLKKLLPEKIDKIYDPTCGNGGLLSVFEDEVVKYGQDINAEQVEEAKERLVNFIGVSGDTLTEPAFMDIKFDYIIANPPFSISWNPFEDERFNAPVLPPKSKADYAFNLHILNRLTDTGIAVVLNFPGILYRGNSEGKIRKWLIEQNVIEKVIHIPGNKFIDTKIATCVIVYNKAKTNTNITFIDDENKLERVVPIEEIIKNDYVLSVNNYVRPEEKKETINPVETEMSARTSFINKLRAELEFSKTICQFEKLDFHEFLEQIKAVIKEFEEV